MEIICAKIMEIILYDVKEFIIIEEKRFKTIECRAFKFQRAGSLADRMNVTIWHTYTCRKEEKRLRERLLTRDSYEICLRDIINNGNMPAQ